MGGALILYEFKKIEQIMKRRLNGESGKGRPRL